MTDHDDADDAHGESNEPQKEWDTRATAPQSPYSGRNVGVGAVVAVVGLLITFGVPLLLTL